MSYPPPPPPEGLGPFVQPPGGGAPQGPPNLSKLPPPAYPGGPAPTFLPPAPPPVPTGPTIALASWGARWGAVTIDLLIRLVLSWSIAFILFAIFSDDPFSQAKDYVDDVSNLEGIFITAFLIWQLVMPFYSTAFLSFWQGQTPGKRAVGIRVVLEETGGPPTFGRAFLREIVAKTWLISWVGGFSGGIAWLLNYLWPLWDPQSRAGHDFMARTRVVKR